MTSFSADSHRLEEAFGSGAAQPLLEVRDLAVSFALRNSRDRVQALNGIRFAIHPNQTLAIVGESGSGKSVTALSVLRLLPHQARIDHGAVIFNGCDLTSRSARQMLSIRGREIAMIFQEPMTSLNPVYTIGQQIIEAIRLHQRVGRRDAMEAAQQALADVGIPQPSQRMHAYPHEFSGGMRQRVMIAMALACRPQLLLADEPTTALDVTIQKQILELLSSLRSQRGMAMMLISHDLGVVASHADVVAVMYAGRIVEQAPTRELFANPLHPYTRALLASTPSLRDRRERLRTINAFMHDPAQSRALRTPDGRTCIAWWPVQDSNLSSSCSTVPIGAARSAIIELSQQHTVLCRVD